MADATMDGLLEAVVERAIERNIDRLAKSAPTRMMRLPRVAAYLDVSKPQARALMKEWGIDPVQYTPGGTVYFEREAIEAAVQRRRAQRELQ